MIFISKEIQNNFIDLLFSVNECKQLGDYFILWNVNNKFKTKTYSNFITEWLSFTAVDKNEYCNIFEGYKSVIEFADWLVVEEERNDFLCYYLLERFNELQKGIKGISDIINVVMKREAVNN